MNHERAWLALHRFDTMAEAVQLLGQYRVDRLFALFVRDAEELAAVEAHVE